MIVCDLAGQALSVQVTCLTVCTGRLSSMSQDPAHLLLSGCSAHTCMLFSLPSVCMGVCLKPANIRCRCDCRKENSRHHLWQDLLWRADALPGFPAPLHRLCRADRCAISMLPVTLPELACLQLLQWELAHVLAFADLWACMHPHPFRSTGALSAAALSNCTKNCLQH